MLADLFLQSKSSNPPLRIGILLDGFELSRAFEAVVDHVQSSNFAKIELLIVNQSAVHPPVRARSSRLITLLRMLRDPKRRQLIGYTLYQEFDARFFPLDDDPLEIVDCSQELANVDTLFVTPITKGFVHRIQPEDIAKIKAYNLDVILRFGFNILKGDILQSSVYGIWSYHHGDNDYYRGGPPHFWELVERRPESGVILQVLTEELDAGQVLTKVIYPTQKGVSLRRNRYTPYWASTTLVIQKLYELHSFGWEHLKRRAVPPQPYLGRRKIYRTPTNAEIGRWFLAESVQVLKRRLRSFFQHDPRWQWRLAIRQMEEPIALADPLAMDGSFLWQTPPAGHFHADPFLFKRDGRVWLFYEDYVYTKDRAVICCREILSDCSLGVGCTVLERPYHLSYPFVFEHEGEVYMIPESLANKTVELYRSTAFPYKWELIKTLLPFRAVDSTLLIRSDGFWLFTTICSLRGEGRCLCLFHSDSLMGEWQPHPLNPISTDSHVCRAAGRFVERNNKTYRLSQDCAITYGASFSFHEVLELSRSEYREKLVATFLPSGNYFGTHAYDSCGSVEVIDGVTWAPASALYVRAEYPPAYGSSNVP